MNRKNICHAECLFPAENPFDYDNCKFVIGNVVKHLGCVYADAYEILRWRSG